MMYIIDIFSLRKSEGKGQSDIADILGINQSQLSEIERGIRPMSAKYEKVLIEQFGKEVCDKFMVEANDNRKITVRGDKNAVAQDSRDDVRQHCASEPSDVDDEDLQKQLDECRAELAKTKKDLEQANKRIDKLLSIIENLSKE